MTQGRVHPQKVGDSRGSAGFRRHGCRSPGRQAWAPKGHEPGPRRPPRIPDLLGVDTSVCLGYDSPSKGIIMYATNQFRKGLKVEIDGVPYEIIDFQHVSPG